MKDIIERMRNIIVYKMKNSVKLGGGGNRIIKNSTSYIKETHIQIQGDNNVIFLMKTVTFRG